MADLAHEGNYLVAFVPGVAGIPNIASPSAATIISGCDLEARITPTGLARDSSTDRKDTTKLNSTFGTQSVGRRNFTLSVTAVREVGDTAGVEAALTYKAFGFLVIRDHLAATTGWATGQKCEVYSVQCDNPNKQPPAVNEDQTMVFGFAMVAEPNLSATTTA
jgi:hypothetical protein